MNHRHLSLPAVRGGLLALLAAALFGVSTPLVQRFGEGLGAFTTACLLYAGAAGVGALSRQRVEREASLLRSDLPRLTAMAAFGAVLGAVALVRGLQHTSGTSASLMLTLEALFTAILARCLHRKTMDSQNPRQSWQPRSSCCSSAPRGTARACASTCLHGTPSVRRGPDRRSPSRPSSAQHWPSAWGTAAAHG